MHAWWMGSVLIGHIVIHDDTPALDEFIRLVLCILLPAVFFAMLQAQVDDLVLVAGPRREWQRKQRQERSLVMHFVTLAIFVLKWREWYIVLHRGDAFNGVFQSIYFCVYTVAFAAATVWAISVVVQQKLKQS
jgi:hypothetical protein